MNPHATAAIRILTDVRQSHTFGHRCEDGRWYNPRLTPDRRTECPVDRDLAGALVDVGLLAGTVENAARDDAAVKHVAWAATGLDMDQLVNEEDRDGWMQTARDAILGLAGWLDENVPNPHPTPGGEG